MTGERMPFDAIAWGALHVLSDAIGEVVETWDALLPEDREGTGALGDAIEAAYESVSTLDGLRLSEDYRFDPAPVLGRIVDGEEDDQ